MKELLYDWRSILSNSHDQHKHTTRNNSLSNLLIRYNKFELSRIWLVLILLVGAFCLLILLIYARKKRRPHSSQLVDRFRLDEHLYINKKVDVLKLSKSHESLDLSNGQPVGHVEFDQKESQKSPLYLTNLSHISELGQFMIVPNYSDSSNVSLNASEATDNRVDVLFTMHPRQQTRFLNHYGPELNPILMAKKAYRKKLRRLVKRPSSECSIGKLKSQIDNYLKNPQLNRVVKRARNHDSAEHLGSSHNSLLKLRHLKCFFADENKSAIRISLYDLKAQTQ